MAGQKVQKLKLNIFWVHIRHIRCLDTFWGFDNPSWRLSHDCINETLPHDTSVTLTRKLWVLNFWVWELLAFDVWGESLWLQCLLEKPGFGIDRFGILGVGFLDLDLGGCTSVFQPVSPKQEILNLLDSDNRNPKPGSFDKLEIMGAGFAAFGFRGLYFCALNFEVRNFAFGVQGVSVWVSNSGSEFLFFVV